MKKLFILLIAFLLLTGCSSATAKSEETVETVNLIKNIKSYYSDGTEYKTITFDYDEDGRLLGYTYTLLGSSKFNEYSTDEYPYTTQVKYNDNGNIVSQITNTSKTHYEYNNNSQLVKKSWEFVGEYANGEVYDTYYEYDEDGKLKSDGNCVYAYDDNGNLISDGVFAYEYDNNNRLIKEFIDYGGRTYTVTHKYDENGNKILIDASDDFSEYDYVNRTINEYKYDNSNNCIEHVWRWYGEDPKTIETFEYNEDNRLIKNTFVDTFVKEWCYITEREYDDNGNLIKWTGYDIDGNYTGVTEYEYIEVNACDPKINIGITDKLIGTNMDDPDHPFYQGI